MQKTKIEWADYVWNPIKGLCPVDCKLPDGQSYCYARRMYQRFKWSPKIQIKEIRFCPKKPSRIFVCSIIELFHPAISREWRNIIFRFIEDCPQHTFQILTKFPQNIDRPMPNNVWLGVSITQPIEMYPKIKSLYQTHAKLKFISFEPLMGDVGQFRFQGWLGQNVDWIIVGRLTGHGHQYDPKQFWIESIRLHAKFLNTPLFLKDNLKEIWGEPLIQEFPSVG